MLTKVKNLLLTYRKLPKLLFFITFNEYKAFKQDPV